MRSHSRAGFPASIALFAGLIMTVTPLNPAPLEAQSSQQRGREMSREEMQIRIIRGFESRVMRELDMSQSQLERIQAILHENRSARGELMKERRALHREMANFAEGGGSEAQARRLLARQRELRLREITLQQEEESALLEVLSPGDLIRFHKMRDDFVERIRELERRGRGNPDADKRSDHRLPASIYTTLPTQYH